MDIFGGFPIFLVQHPYLIRFPSFQAELFFCSQGGSNPIVPHPKSQGLRIWEPAEWGVKRHDFFFSVPIVSLFWLVVFSHPSEKICSSNRKSSPIVGVKIKNVWNNVKHLMLFFRNLVVFFEGWGVLGDNKERGLIKIPQIKERWFALEEVDALLPKSCGKEIATPWNIGATQSPWDSNHH